MPNVVFDASVLISAALRPGSVPAQALRAARECDTLVVSEETLEELVMVLARPKFARVLSASDRFAFLEAFCARVEFCVPDQRVTECRDAKDNKYLELALVSEAWAIVSGDDDLLILNPFRGIVVLPPAGCITALGARNED